MFLSITASPTSTYPIRHEPSNSELTRSRRRHPGWPASSEHLVLLRNLTKGHTVSAGMNRELQDPANEACSSRVTRALIEAKQHGATRGAAPRVLYWKIPSAVNVFACQPHRLGKNCYITRIQCARDVIDSYCTDRDVKKTACRPVASCLWRELVDVNHFVLDCATYFQDRQFVSVIEWDRKEPIQFSLAPIHRQFRFT